MPWVVASSAATAGPTYWKNDGGFFSHGRITASAPIPLKMSSRCGEAHKRAYWLLMVLAGSPRIGELCLQFANAALRAVASDHEDARAFVEEAEVFARSCDPPLPIRAAQDTARSVWNYKVQGRLIAPQRPATLIPAGALAILKLCRDYPLALALYTVLGSTRHTAKSFTIPIARTAGRTGMSPATIQKCIRMLERHHLLRRVGKRDGSPTRRSAILYRFSPPAMLSHSIEGYTG
jgi:hypothetical protein